MSKSCKLLLEKVKLFSPPKWHVHMFQLVKKHQLWKANGFPGFHIGTSSRDFALSVEGPFWILMLHFHRKNIRLFGYRRIKSRPLKNLELSCLENPWDDRWQIWTIILSKSSRFKMMIYPEMVNEGKGGSCFRTPDFRLVLTNGEFGEENSTFFGGGCSRQR